RRAARRSGRLASLRPPQRSAKHHAGPATRKMSRTEPAGKRLAVHARQLALKPGLQILRRHRRPLLRRLEQARRSTLENHVHRNARLGVQVLISERWYYLFEDRFGRPGKGNDKGKVEGLVGYARRNFLVPIPVFESFEALNVYLLECCRRRMADYLRGHDGAIRERLERDLAAFQKPLPPAYDACEKVPTRVSSLSLVRYRLNDYSVPTTYGHRDVLVRGYVHHVVITCGAEAIARHPRSYERDDFVFDPLHYLALIEQKINALDQAAPLAGWRLPEEFMTLRRLMEARMGKQGKREFVQVLRLMEVFRPDEVAAAVRDAIARGAIGFDAVKHLALCRIERRPPRLDMTVYPYLPRANVAMTSAKTYLDLLTGASS